MFVNFFQIFISILILRTIEGIRQNITGGSFIKNKYSYSPVILAFDNVGPLMCIKNCLLHKGCKAVNFNGSQFECELLNVTFPYDMLTDIKGSFYTEIDGWTKDKDGCTPNPCEVGQRCVPAMYNNYICLKIDLPCDVNLCQHKYGVCRNKVNGYRCICQDGYYGDYCEHTPCTDVICNSGSNCYINGSDGICMQQS
ncbi:neurogenic locus notch homolog protein 1-like [Mytilus californianus]|uniref:neurogenic locus notch homolog protein 1-like n=1 Tax=Mytilus californianus TaxID=6549 RepID=UPI002247409A|nr:neurogenic locus notch homolog protein 1-like [Mytilus californianus]